MQLVKCRALFLFDLHFSTSKSHFLSVFLLNICICVRSTSIVLLCFFADPSLSLQVMIYGVLDIMSKAVFGFILLLSHEALDRISNIPRCVLLHFRCVSLVFDCASVAVFAGNV